MASTSLSEATQADHGASLLEWGDKRGEQQSITEGRSFLRRSAAAYENERRQVQPGSGEHFLQSCAQHAAAPTSYHHSSAREPDDHHPHTLLLLSHSGADVQPSRTTPSIHRPNHALVHTNQALDEDSCDGTSTLAALRTPSHVFTSHLRTSYDLPHAAVDCAAAQGTQTMPSHPRVENKASQSAQDSVAPNKFDMIATPPLTKKAIPAHLPKKNDNDKIPDGNGSGPVATDILHDSPTSHVARSVRGVAHAKAPQITVNNVAIAQRLAKDHGVKVSQPKPAKSSQRKDPGYREGDRLRIEDDMKLPSIPESRSPPSHTNRQGRGRGGGRGRGRGRGGKSRPPRESRWPHPSETRPDPKRWDTNWEGNGNDWDASGCMEAEWGTPNEQTNDAGQLADWSGNWAPAPIDWDSRPAFRDGQSTEKIEKWMSKVEEEMRGIDATIPMSDLVLPDKPFSSLSDTKSANVMHGEPAPRYWIPQVINNVAPQTFWNDFANSKSPPPFDEADLKEVKPWWALYGRGDSIFLQPYQQPDMCGIDPHDENEDERLARENDYGSSQHAKNRKRKERALKDAERERRKKMQEKLARLSPAKIRQRQRSEIRPGIKVVVRSAKVDDVARIREIYNYYVENSVAVPELQQRTDEDVKTLLLDVQKNTFPFLVACEKGQKVRGSKRYHNGEDIVLPDKVVGFAYANDFYDKMSMYMATANVNVMVDSQFHKKGVGQCLFDKLLGLLDGDYIERGGYNVIRVAGDMDGEAPMRQISNMIVKLPYDSDDSRQMEWTSRWLEEGLGFEQVGHLKAIGLKEEKTVNLAIFQRRIGYSAPVQTNHLDQ